MKEILITVSGKIAKADENEFIVNGNGDITARFVFDAEWDNSGTKTAVFVLSDGSTYYKILKDDLCSVPVLYNTSYVKIGVKSAALQTSTGATVKCRPCIIDDAVSKAPITENLYDQLCGIIDERCAEAAASVHIGSNGNWWVNGTDTKISAYGKKGEQGIQGLQGEKGEKGDSYVLTASDKAEIASQIENSNVVLPPMFVRTVEDMTDTDKIYVLASTGKIWAYMDTTVQRTVTERADDGYTYPENSRLGSDGSVAQSGSYAGYTVTPFIDLNGYPVPFDLHLDGAGFIASAKENYTRMAVYDQNKTLITCGHIILSEVDNFINVNDADVKQDANGNTTISFDSSIAGDTAAKYIRFSGKINAEPSVYVTYEKTMTGPQWVDTGISYAPAVTEGEIQSIADLIVSRIDTELLSVIGDGVIE